MQMTEENIEEYTNDELDQLPDETDWERVDAMTDADLEAAVEDPSERKLTEEELNQFRRAIYVDGEEVWVDDKTICQLLENGEDLALIPVDRGVLEWFKGKGKDYLVQMNKVLHEYIEAQD